MTRKTEETLNTILIEIQLLKERTNLLERQAKRLEERIESFEEFKHKTHTGYYATTDDLKAIDTVIKNIVRGSA